MRKSNNPYLEPFYGLYFKVNKRTKELILKSQNKGLCYGMRKKLSQQQPQTYPLNKLVVNLIKN